jgi:hypothetical protein
MIMVQGSMIQEMTNLRLLPNMKIKFNGMKMAMVNFTASFQIACIILITGCSDRDRVYNPKVEVEEEVYRFVPAQNGAGPMWCHGSTSIVRIGDKVYASGIETVPEWKILNNCRWMLFERDKNGWKKIITDTAGRTREPSPIAAYRDGHFFLSANPTMTDTSAYNGPSKPEMYMFNSKDDLSHPERLIPVWDGVPPFTEHSYRSLAADGSTSELILFQNIEYTHAEWSRHDKNGIWSVQGKLVWPWGSENEVPGPIRVCYPNVMMKGHAVYFCGVSDIIEPKKAWRDYKRELTGNEWDYDFRRLFFTWADDISTGQFRPWIEIASREETCGWIFPGDLWVAPDGAVHILWTERAIDERLREKFFPDAKQSHSINYAVVRNGKIDLKKTILSAEEGLSNEIPGQARFHITLNSRLMIVYFVKGTNADGKPVSENRIVELSSDGTPGNPVTLALKHPFSNFFTATPRAGSEQSDIIDILGTPDGVNNAVYYARISVK